MSLVDIVKTVYTETAHRLLGYPGKCANVHGHSYRWSVSLLCQFPHPEQKYDIAYDFGDLKQLLEYHVVRVYDHAIVLHRDDPLLQVSGEKEFGKLVVFDQNPTAEVLALRTLDRLSDLVRSVPYIRGIRISLGETCTSAVLVERLFA